MLHPKLYPYRVALLLLCLVFTGAAIGQRLLKKEEGFPLNQPIHERGITVCDTEETALKLVTLHSQKGIEAARDYFNDPKVPCYTEEHVMVVYKRFVFSVKTAQGERNVYEAESDFVPVYVITDWRHRPSGIDT